MKPLSAALCSRCIYRDSLQIDNASSQPLSTVIKSNVFLNVWQGKSREDNLSAMNLGHYLTITIYIVTPHSPNLAVINHAILGNSHNDKPG